MGVIGRRINIIKVINGGLVLILLLLHICVGCGTGKNGNNLSNTDIHPIHLKNRAVLFDEYLYIQSNYVDLVFTNEDGQGIWHSWESPANFFTGIEWGRQPFHYGDYPVCIGENEEGGRDIIVYDQDFMVLRRNEIPSGSAWYVYKNFLYSSVSGGEYRKIIRTNLDTLESEEIYSDQESGILDFGLNEKGELIIPVIRDSGKYYCKYKDGNVISLFRAGTGRIVHCDERGIFFMEEGTLSDLLTLKLWDGEQCRTIKEIPKEGMDPFLFRNGIAGSIIIENDFFVSIHEATEVPYLLVHFFNSGREEKLQLEKWGFTEADMERYGETFSGAYYEDGKIIRYFFSNTAGELQTQVLDIKQLCIG